MTETWLPFCVRRDGPSDKQGYYGIPSRSLPTINGFCMHSMEGSLAGALGRMDNPSQLASWSFSNPKSGQMLQHYPLESITWTSGGPVPNIRFIGIEHEGIAGETLNENQQANDTQLMLAIQPLVSISHWVRQDTLWEHQEMTRFGSDPTACPSGRIPWDILIARLTEEDMTPEQDLRLKKVEQLLEQLTGPGDNWVVDNINRQTKAAFDAASKAIQVPIQPAP